jgi:hypothetical protein
MHFPERTLWLMTYGDKEPNPGAKIVEDTFRIISEAMGMKLIGGVGIYTGNGDENEEVKVYNFLRRIVTNKDL